MAPARFAALADIHGNADALDAVLADAATQDVEDVVVLGDHLSGPLAADETAERLIASRFLAILGNHDRWLIDRPPELMGSWERDAWPKLARRHLDWLRSLPATAEHEGALLLHGVPGDDDCGWLDKVGPDETRPRAPSEIEAFAEGIGQRLVLTAHTHLAGAARLADGRLVVNSGSVGCPAFDGGPYLLESGAPDARYAILEAGPAGWCVSFRLVPYDPSRMAAMAETARRPDWACALRTGRIVR